MQAPRASTGNKVWTRPVQIEVDRIWELGEIVHVTDIAQYLNWRWDKVRKGAVYLVTKDKKVKVKCLYLYWITLSATWAVLPRGPIRATPHESSVTTGGNRSTRRKPAMVGRDKLDNTLLTYDKGNFNQITARSWNRNLVTVGRNTCTTTVPSAPPWILWTGYWPILPSQRGWTQL